MVLVEYFKANLTKQEQTREIKEIYRNRGKCIFDPTIEEVMDMINKTSNGKALGTDKCRTDKVPRWRVTQKIYILMKKIWVEENMTEEREKYTIHKNGDQQVCKNYRKLLL